MRGNDLHGLMTEETNADIVVDMHVFSKQVTPAAGGSESTITLQMKVPEYQQIRYVPNELQSLIEMFAQYLAVLIPVIYVLWNVCLHFAFNRRILAHKEVSEIEHMLKTEDKGARYSQGSRVLTSRFDF